ncbi:ATP-dependent DNA helicase Q4 [Prorops nasuta]|uniref:ATP-dependent DNA helicase Q4 n=1 Tax=Prorops nasuta TaxID=863751 RepID=UPI0034CFA2AA
MELLEDPHFKTKYQKNKLRVKLWESDFMEKYGRKPNKNDIKEADVSIKEAYKMYWKLKTRALEETLTDITFCEDIQANTSLNSSTQNVAETENNKMTENKKDTENIIPYIENSSEHTKSLNKPEVSNVDGVWGSHLTKSNETAPKKKSNLLIGRSSSFQLSKNKFSGSNFIKRNPRKSLSTTKIKIKSDANISTALSFSQPDPDNKDGFDINEESKILFGDSFKVVNVEHKPTTQALNTVQQLIEGNVITTNRKLNQGWLDRCSKESHVEAAGLQSQRFSIMSTATSDSGIDSMESSLHSPKDDIPLLNSSKPTTISDDEDFICNSDSEEERKNKRCRNYRKRLSDENSQINKKPRLESDTGFSNSSNDKSLTSPTQTVLSKINCAIPDSIEKEEELYISKSINNFNKVNEINKITIEEVNRIDKNVCDTLNETNTNKNEANQIVPKSEAVVEKSVKPIKRVKKILSSESDDLDYKEDSKIKKTTKRVTRTRSTRKVVKPKASLDEKKKTVRKTRQTRNTVVKEPEEEEKLDPENIEDAIPIYGVETLKAVPRIPICTTGTGDLVADFSKSVSMSNPNIETNTKNPNKQLTDKEKLDEKLISGKINDNFVRINLKKKVFVRGKKNFNFSKYKKNQWKQRRKELGSGSGSLDVADLAEKNGGVLKCFKCGDIGHFSRNCKALKSDELIPIDKIDDTSEFPTLEEVEKMAAAKATIVHSSRIHLLPEKTSGSLKKPESVTEIYQEEDDLSEAFGNDDFSETLQKHNIPCGHKIPEKLLSRLMKPMEGNTEPLYPVGDNFSLVDTPEEVYEALRMFGHENFRPGQEKAIMRILSGLSTLVTLSTGSGKSLCYQLPAYLYSKQSHCITLVISPLVSLMDDQVTGIPSFLSAASLHTNLSPKVRENVMQLVKDGKINVLLVSPEAVVAGEKSSGFGALMRQLPPIAFACIDEAHCISQWSHNFRPSYLLLSRVLKEKLGVKTILSLTATATRSTSEGIVDNLGIADGMQGVISDIPMPNNLFMTVSKDEYRDHALVSLLKSKRFIECDSVIVYCTRRDECARIAGFLRISLQDPKNPEKSNIKVSTIAEAYHAGLSAHRRKIVQKAFMNGATRIIVATVAFGMGINKTNIRSVIHFNMPGSFEGYVQEVGRAGRDGLPAHCHLFLSSQENSDKWELQRHIYANGVDRHMIRKLLQKVFLPCSCTNEADKAAGRRCPGHEVAIPIDETVRALDIPEEMISTLLCYLELHPKRYIKLLSSVYINARVSSYSGPQALKVAAKDSPPLAMAIALDLKKGISHENSSVIEFPIVSIASAIGWDSGIAKSYLKNLEWKTVNGQIKRSAISVKYDTLGLRVKAPGDLSEVELDEALEELVSRAQLQENSRLLQLETISKALNKFSVHSVKQCINLDEDMMKKSNDLKDTIRNYFQSDLTMNNESFIPETRLLNEGEIINDIRNLIISYRDNNFTGRAVARIFHGIQSPNYPALVWSKCRFWRAHLSTNFNAICQLATKEILALL